MAKPSGAVQAPTPAAVRGISVRPVWAPERLHSVSPWRISQSSRIRAMVANPAGVVPRAIPPSCARMHKAEPYATSHRAERDGLLQGRHGVLERDKLVGEIAFEFQVGDGLRDGAPVEFLGFVEFVAAGDAAGVEVADVLDVVADGADDVAFHDLHV